MTKRMLIDSAHPEEVRVVIEEDGRIDDFEVETAGKEQLKGNIYVGVVTRVEPSLQAAFISYGGNRNGFLAFSEIHPTYFDLPEEERQGLLDELQSVADRRADRETEREDRWETTQAEKEARKLGRTASKMATRLVDGINADEDSDSEHSPSDDMSTDVADTPDEAADDTPAPKKRTRRRSTRPARARKPQADESTESNTNSEESSDKPVLLAATPVDEIVAGDSETTAENDDALTGIMSDDKSDVSEKTDGVTELAKEASEITEEVKSDKPRRRVRTPRRPRRHSKSEEEENGTDTKPEKIVDDIHDGLASPAQADAEEDDEKSGGERKQAIHRRYSIGNVLKEGQKVLIQVCKEERGNKGAALSTYISLPGRFTVLMPNTPYAGGISRKVTDMETRRELKRVVKSLEVPNDMGLIVRTAGVGQEEACVKKDVQNLLNHWTNIQEGFKTVTKAPALLHEDGSLAIRAMRDLFREDIDEVVISGKKTYQATKAYVKSLLPENAKRIKEHRAQTPLFSHYGVEDMLNKLHTVRVNLPSGGYLIINPTEALISVDVNSGKATQQKNIEETAINTNLEAAEEVARQLRLRDLAGLVVIDFIDMENSKNERAVERCMRKAIRKDRARIQTASISQFGLMEMSRQRLRPSINESVQITCPHCHGTGTVPSLASAALTLLRTLESDTVRSRAERVVITTSHDMALYILNTKRDLVADIENRYGFEIALRGEDNYVAPDHRLEIVHTDSRGNEKRTSQEIVLREMLDEDDFKQRKRKRSTKKKDDEQKPHNAPHDNKAESDNASDDNKGEHKPHNKRRRTPKHADNDNKPVTAEMTETDNKETNADGENDGKQRRRRTRKRSSTNNRNENNNQNQSTAEASNKEASTDNANNTTAPTEDGDKQRKRRTTRRPRRDNTDRNQHSNTPVTKQDDAPKKGITVETISVDGKKTAENKEGSSVTKAFQRWWSKS